jgi:hypothetical protein
MESFDGGCIGVRMRIPFREIVVESEGAFLTEDIV